MIIESIKADSFTMSYFKFGTGKRTFVILPGLSVQSVMPVADAIEKAYSPLANAAKGFDATRELEGISCPTLVVGDTDDRIFGCCAAGEIHARLKNSSDAELYLYSGYGHACCDTAPDFKERILRFLI